jgi:hypothetical protein
MKSSFTTTLKTLASVGILIVAGSTALADGTIFLETGPGYNDGSGPGTNPYQYGNGGEFTALTTGLTVQLTPGTDAPAGYNSNATFTVNGVTGFETFCVEDQVDFSPGGTYNYTLGTPGTGAGAVLQQSTATIKQLTAGAAWLYEQFATGQLAGYNYTNTADRLADAGLLQATLWALQGEPQDPTVPFDSNASTNFALADIDAEFGSFTGAQGIATSQYGVSLLELTSGSGANLQDNQDQLIYWGPAVPDNATTALLIGASFLIMAGFSRRFRAARSK